ncbi:MAG: GNAT family N-acetyltransferase [Spirochaetia bacterium]|nr:GNAT family N-acetyltransferase [Spirochaetia bacterium]
MDLTTKLAKMDYLSYIDIIQPLKEGVAEILVDDEAGVLVRIQDATYAAAVFDANQSERFAKALHSAKLPKAVHEGPLLQYLLDQGYKPTLRCVQAVYTAKEPLDVDPNLKIRPVYEADLDLIVTHYTHAEPSYVRDRVRSRTMLGLEIDGELAAFMGRHSEGAMGLLEVLPQYRRRHLGQQLESAYINLMLEQGLVPYCNVEMTNTASLALQRKLGLVFAKQHVYWFN